MNMEKVAYIAPEMVVVEVELEQGFAGSNDGIDDWQSGEF